MTNRKAISITESSIYYLARIAQRIALLLAGITTFSLWTLNIVSSARFLSISNQKESAESINITEQFTTAIDS